MPWKQVSPGNWERPLNSTELLLKTNADLFKGLDREHCAVNLIAEVRFEIKSQKDNIEFALRHAWTQIRYQHPFIATTLNGDNHRYHIPTEEELDGWIRQSLIVHDTQTVAEFLLTAPFTEYSSLHYFKSSSEILLRIHHWLTDGFGSLYLLDRFLTYLSTEMPSPSFGDEYTRLPPGLFEAVGLPAQLSATSDAAAQDAFMSYVTKMPSVGLPVPPPAAPKGTKIFKLSSPASTLAALLSAAREQKLGLAAAVHSAIILATFERAPEDHADRPFLTVGVTSQRKLIKAPYQDTTKWPLGTYVVNLPFSQPKADFTTTATNLQKFYSQDLDPENSSALDWYPGFLDRIVRGMTAPRRPGMVAPSQPQFSSIGSVDGKIKTSYVGTIDVDVENVEVVLDYLAPSLMIYQWSYKGIWHLSVNYSENWYSDADAEEFLRRVKEILFQNLGIEDLL